MGITGIICEYNPLHTGHKKQIDTIKCCHPGDGIVCLMSGNYVQRGAPAIFDKTLRARAAVLCGADLVLELPLTASLSSAEGFASEGVRILSSFCSRLCFGAETADKASLLSAAQALLSENFPQRLHTELSRGISFPAARQAALQAMGVPGDTLSLPNDILATEYCKAILQQGASMEPMPILRQGSYRSAQIDRKNPSATALRQCIAEGGSWLGFVPEAARAVFENAVPHQLSAGEQAILYRLRTMSDEEFEALPYGSEGLWRKLMHNARKFATLEEILAATKSKRYTRSRLDRMVMCAFLGIAREDMASHAPYVRVLALNDRGREILKTARKGGCLPNAGDNTESSSSYQSLEHRAGLLYSMFSPTPCPPAREEDRRIFYQNAVVIDGPCP